MNVEKAIEFLIQSQARAEARMDKFDTRLEATRKLVEAGMKMLVRIEKSQKKTDERLATLAASVDGLTVNMDGLTVKMEGLTVKMEELADAQKLTEKRLQAYFDSLRDDRRKNGH